jgi:hypothetical protein
MRIRVKGFQIFRDRHEKMRCYHRITRTPVNLDEAPLGSTEFFAQCAPHCRTYEDGRATESAVFGLTHETEGTERTS